MTATAEHPSPGALRQLSTLRELAQDELLTLSNQLYVHEGRRGNVLLELGATDDATLYLLEGSCRLIAADGGVKVMQHTDPSAQAPLARLRPSHYRVVAESNVRYLRIDSPLLAQVAGSFDKASSLSLETYEVEEDDDYGAMDAENRLTLQIYEDLNTDRLLLPSLPHVAVRIGEAVNDELADARRVAALIETDPAIAIKVVKAANSARFGGVSQVATVTEAVARLGMQNTQILVITFALRELFRTSSKALQQRMLALWEHSRRVAAITQVLAEKIGGYNAHQALLSGLVHDIGVLAVIGYARDFPDVVERGESLEASIQALRSQLGGMILSKWQLPPELMIAAKEAENWYRDHDGKPDYADLVIVAQIHEGIAGDLDPSQIPVLARVGLSPQEVDKGLDILHAAQEEIDDAKQLLAG
jgi:HD-like signal output (HDOD) protein